MAIPEPEQGLVINYTYLWHHEHAAGHEEGRKDRPSVIVLAVDRASDGSHRGDSAAGHAHPAARSGKRDRDTGSHQAASRT